MTPAPATLAAAAVQIICCLAVLGLGDRPARLAGAGLIANVCATLAFQDRDAWLDPAHRILLIDTLLLALLALLTARSPRNWLIAATAFQLLAVISDAVMIFDRVPQAKAWLTVTIGFGWGVFACVLWGGYAAWRRRGRAEA